MKKKDIGTEETLYRFGLVAALVAAISFLLWQAAPEGVREWTHRWSFCVIYRFTGYLCPGCGGTRALRELMQGHFLASVLYHPLVLYGLGLYIVFMGSHTWAKAARLVCRTGKITGLKWRNGYITVAVCLLIGNFAIKNLIHLITGMDVLAQLERLLAGCGA